MHPLTSQCTAVSRHTKERCKKLVKGGGVCRSHGGAAPQVIAKRRERVAIYEAAQWNAPLPITGEDALLQELNRTNGQVVGLEFMHQQDPSDAGVTMRFMAERGHLLQTAKAIVQLDVRARQATFQEALAGDLVLYTRELVLHLGLDPTDPAITEAVHAAIARVESSKDGLDERARQIVRSA